MERPAAEDNRQQTVSPYILVGGEAGTRRIADAFYDAVETDPAYSRLRALHPGDLGDTRTALFEFLSGWLGGPPLYQNSSKRGCIMSAHAHLAIDAELREQWLSAMRRALADAGLAGDMRELLDGPFARIAEMMRNR